MRAAWELKLKRATAPLDEAEGFTLELDDTMPSPPTPPPPQQQQQQQQQRQQQTPLPPPRHQAKPQKTAKRAAGDTADWFDDCAL